MLSTPYRGFPATLLETGDLSILFDCGDGTIGRMRAMGNPMIDAVAITSISVSEVAGLLTFAEANRRLRRNALRVYGPPGLADALQNLGTLSSIGVSQLFDIQESCGGHTLLEAAGKHLEAVEVDVGKDRTAIAYLVYESPLPGRVDPVKAASRGIKGRDFAQLQAGETVRGVRPGDVIGPRRPGRRILVGGRGRATDALMGNLEGSDAAIFAAPFMDERLEMAEDTHYFTGWEAAELSTRARVKVVLLQQLGPYAPVRHQIAEARQFHGRLFAPDDADVLRVPLPEAGLPTLERAFQARRDTGQQRKGARRAGA
jgi:ribonuclease Z